MKKRVLKLFLALAVMFGLSLFFGKLNASAVATPEVFADSIYVGGVELQSGDFLESGSTNTVDSILEIDKSKGFAYYDGNELLLSNYTYEGEGIRHNDIEKSVIFGTSTGSDTLVISVYGNNTLANTYSGSLFACNGIYIEGNLQIDGTGVLNVNAKYGLFIGNNLVFNYAKTNINGSVYAILAGGNITINDGTVNATTTNPVTAGSGKQITINGGSITVSSSNATFNVCPSYTEEVYNKSVLTVSENMDGSEPSASFDKTNFNKYKYFSLKESSREKKNNIYVSNFNVPSVSKTVSQIEEQTTLDYGLDAEAYECDSITVEKKVDDNWVALDSDYVLRYNENYRVVLDILPKEGYTINSNIGSVTGYINESKVDVFEIVEYAEYYGAKIGYEFIFETTDKEVTSFSTTLELPKIGQVYGDIKYSSADITCSEGFSYSTFQIYEGTTVLEETKALKKDVTYTLVLGFKLEGGYYAFDIENATINGNAPTKSQFDGNILVLSYEFKLTTTSIESIDVTQVKAPNAGEKISNIDTTRFLLGEGYELADVKYLFEEEECSADTVIEYDKDYSYTFIFKAKEGYELTSSTAAKINGVAATCNYDESNNTIQVKYILKHESTPIDAVFITGVIFPEVGDKVVDVDLSDVSYASEKYELHDIVCWFSYSDDEVTDDTILQYDIEYAYTFVFVAKEGYKFVDENALVNGFIASSWYGTHEGGETVYFEAYYYHIIESDKKEITEIEIYNYDIPNVGQKLSDVVNTNDTLVFGGEYKIVDQKLGIYDIDLDETVDYNGEIQRGPEYSIYLLLEANEGYKFSLDMEHNAVIINSDRAICFEVVKDGNRYMSVLYWFNYPEVSEEIEINSIEISNVDIPKVGETLSDTTNTPDTILWGEGYEIENLLPFMVVDGNLVSRIPMDYEIGYNEEYAFVFNIEAKEGYIFSLIEKATVNNDYAVILGMDSDGVLAIGYFFSYKTYDIYVADKDEEGNTIGVQVSDMNKDDVLGDGTVSYDPKTNTLTLNNYTYEGEGFDVDGGYVAIQLDLYENDVTIILKRENVINITGEHTSGILAFGDYNLNIEGDGSLEINSTMHGIGFQGEFGTITINGPEIVINSEGAMTTGIWAPNFVMKAGSLKIDSTTLGIIVISESSKIDINGGSIEISVSVAGNTIAYMDGTMIFVPTLANLEEYALTYKVIGGTKSDGSNADKFDEELIDAYKYFKISHACNLKLIEQVNPTCTEAGKNAYYRCEECDKCYEDEAGKTLITDIDTWGIIQAAHNFNDSWKSDENNHWKECDCKEKKDGAAHVDANNDGKCDTCSYEMQTQSGTPTEPKPEKKVLSGGAVAAIVISSVAVTGVSGFAIFWFVIRKKKFADLIAVFKKK